MRVFLIAFFFLFVLSSSVPKPLDVVKQMMAVYEKHKVYSVDMKFSLYKGHTSGEVFESYLGLLYKHKKKAYQKISDTEFIISPEFCVKVVHPQKVVELSTGHEFVNQELDFKTISKECSTFNIVEQEDYYLVSMIISHTSQIEFEKVLLKIYKKNMHLAQVDLFYSTQQNFSKNPNKPNLQKPHLRILYSNFTSQPKISSNVFNYSTYFESSKSIIKLSKQFEHYEFIDNRF